MTALCIVLGVLFLLAILPIGVLVRYDSSGPLVKVVAGPIGIRVLPKKAKKKNPKKDKKPKAEKKKKVSAKKTAENRQPETNLGGKVKDFIPFVKMGLNFLGDIRRKLRVNRLELKVTLAGDDPADLAVNYGRANGALGALWPMLERCFKIKKRDVSVRCDFTAEETTVFAALRITITLGRSVALVVRYGVRALIEFIKLKNKKKAVQSI